MPPKKVMQDEKKIPKRTFLFQRFITAVLKCEVFKCSNVLVAFVRAANRPDWESQVAKAEGDRGFRILSLDGEINVRQAKESERFVKRIPEVIQEYEKRTGLTA